MQNEDNSLEVLTLSSDESNHPISVGFKNNTLYIDLAPKCTFVDEQTFAEYQNVQIHKVAISLEDILGYITNDDLADFTKCFEVIGSFLKNKEVQSLTFDFEGKLIPQDIWEVNCELIKELPLLKKLHVGYYNFEDGLPKKYMTLLVKALAHVNDLKDLTVAFENLTPKSAKVLANYLAENSTIEKFTFGCLLFENSLSISNALFNGLQLNKSIVELNLPNIYFHKLPALLKDNDILEKLKIEGPIEDEQDYDLLFSALKNNSTLKSFVITNYTSAVPTLNQLNKLKEIFPYTNDLKVFGLNLSSQDDSLSDAEDNRKKILKFLQAVEVSNIKELILDFSYVNEEQIADIFRDHLLKNVNIKKITFQGENEQYLALKEKILAELPEWRVVSIEVEDSQGSLASEQEETQNADNAESAALAVQMDDEHEGPAALAVQMDDEHEGPAALAVQMDDEHEGPAALAVQMDDEHEGPAALDSEMHYGVHLAGEDASNSDF